MLDLTPQDIAEFRALHKRETGRDIADAEARAYALSIIQLVYLVLKKSVRSETLPQMSFPPDIPAWLRNGEGNGE